MGKEKSKKRRKSSHSSDSSPDSSKVRKLKKKLKKEQRKAEKALKKKLKEEKMKLKLRSKSNSQENASTSQSQEEAFDVPLDLMERSKSMAPMTKEEWEEKQSVVRRVLDEESGRYRLIKGDGEVLEEIVTRDRHKDINRRATQADGAYFQSQISHNKH